LSKIQKQSFIEGALIMAIANLVVKIIGAFFKIPLANLLGDEASGMFTVAYNFYSALVVVSTAGLPVAVSRMVAEANSRGRGREVERILKVAFRVFILIGAVSMVIMFLGAKPFVNWQKTPSAYYAVLAISPAVFFVALMSVYRGFYQGLSNMVPTAISQLIEALCKLFLGLGLAWFALKNGYGLEMAAAGAILGVTIGTVLGSAYVVLRHRRAKETMSLSDFDPTTRKDSELVRSLIMIAIPILLGSAVLSLTNFLDMTLVYRRLSDIGFAESKANALYGNYSLKALSIMTMPQTLIVGVTTSLIPAIAAACAAKDYDKARRNTESAYRLTSMMAFPCAAGMITMAWPVINLLFSEGVDTAAPLLRTLGVAFLFVSLASMSTAVLQAAGRERLPVISTVAGGIVKLVTNYILIGIPSINIAGAPIGTTMCYATIAIFNIVFVYTKTEIGPKQWYVIWKPLVSAVVMGIVATLLWPVVSGVLGAKLGALVVICLCVVVYFAMMLIVKGFYKDDILMLPKGAKIARVLRLK